MRRQQHRIMNSNGHVHHCVKAMACVHCRRLTSPLKVSQQLELLAEQMLNVTCKKQKSSITTDLYLYLYYRSVSITLSEALSAKETQNVFN